MKLHEDRHRTIFLFANEKAIHGIFPVSPYSALEDAKDRLSLEIA